MNNLRSNFDLEIEYKRLKLEKGRISAQFKNHAKGSSEHQQLLVLMKDISRELKLLESSIKERKSEKTINADNHHNKKYPFEEFQRNKLWHEKIYFSFIEENELLLWDNFLFQCPHFCYSNSFWLNIIKKSLGRTTRILVATDGKNNILGGLPLTYFSNRFFGRFAVSAPFVNYGGIITIYKNVAEQLLKEAKKLLKSENLEHIEVREIQNSFEETYSDKKVSMILKLPEENEILERELGSKLRAQCKRADTYNPEFLIGKLELLDDFYQVFSINMRDLGTPVYPKSLFRHILESPQIHANIALLKINGKAVSCGLLIANGDILEIPWASTLRKANTMNANMGFYRRVLTYAIESGFQYFDFGRSTKGAGTYKFKCQWGATPYQHYWYYLLAPETKTPQLNPDNPKLKLLVSAWKLIPVWITRLIGPIIIRNIP